MDRTDSALLARTQNPAVELWIAGCARFFPGANCRENLSNRRASSLEALEGIQCLLAVPLRLSVGRYHLVLLYRLLWASQGSTSQQSNVDDSGLARSGNHLALRALPKQFVHPPLEHGPLTKGLLMNGRVLHRLD